MQQLPFFLFSFLKTMSHKAQTGLELIHYVAKDGLRLHESLLPPTSAEMITGLSTCPA